MSQIKIILGVLLLVCLAKMPYGYYELVRIIAIVGFSVLAYLVYLQKRYTEMVIYIGLVLLFQPFVKIALGRELWNFVDVIVAVWLFSSIFLKAKGDSSGSPDEHERFNSPNDQAW